jgi:hypothetical protein
VEHKGDFWVEPMPILDWRIKVIKKKATGLVKFQWTYYGPEDATWKHEEAMREANQKHFAKFEEN